MDKGIVKLIALGIICLVGVMILGTRNKFEIIAESDFDMFLKQFNKLITINPKKVATLKKST